MLGESIPNGHDPINNRLASISSDASSFLTSSAISFMDTEWVFISLFAFTYVKKNSTQYREAPWADCKASQAHSMRLRRYWIKILPTKLRHFVILRRRPVLFTFKQKYYIHPPCSSKIIIKKATSLNVFFPPIQ